MPDMEAITEYIAEPGRGRWRDMASHIQNTYGTEPEISYSVCAGKPGWNVKYKKGGKALCTLYPEPEGFVALIVLASEGIARFEAERSAYTVEVNRLFDDTRVFNRTKWLMISVDNDSVLADACRLIALKRMK